MMKWKELQDEVSRIDYCLHCQGFAEKYVSPHSCYMRHGVKIYVEGKREPCLHCNGTGFADGRERNLIAEGGG